MIDKLMNLAVLIYKQDTLCHIETAPNTYKQYV